MKKHSFIFLFLFFCCVPLACIFASFEYEVEFSGIENKELMTAIKNSSELINLQKLKPETRIALKRRSEIDLKRFSEILEALGFFEAFLDLKIDFKKEPVKIQFIIEEGEQYPLRSFSMFSPEGSLSSFCFDTIDLCKIDVELGKPALASTILKAEEKVLEKLAKRGYPLAVIVERKVIVDQKDKQVDVSLEIEPGPLSLFGRTIIKGSESVDPLFFQKKTAWRFNTPYQPKPVLETQNGLEASNLFTSVEITHGDTLDDQGFLPMYIEVDESKHKTFGIGVNYATELGPGITVEWENRNLRQMGEKINFTTNLWADTQDATLLYLIPDFTKRNQDFLWLAEYQLENLEPYTESSFSLSGSIEEHVNKRMRISYGLMFKQLALSRSDDNRTYNLGKAPFQMRYTKTNNALDPTNGYSVTARLIPTMQLLPPCFSYFISRFTGAVYAPLNYKNTLSLAAKVNIGLISGSSRRTIPTSERFFAGSDNTIRGYRYLTVSPYDDVNNREKPTGGRSMMIGSFELRWHATQDIGWTCFLDAGNVYRPPFPDFEEKVLKAVGLGFRYYTPVGPLRFDLAFPLNRRHKPEKKKEYIDGPFQIYASVGQAF